MQIPQDPHTSRSSVVSRSISFWLSLGVALGLYGLAILSPKLASREQLLFTSHAQQIQLVREEQKLTRLQLVTASLQQDSRFVDKLLQKDRNSRQNGEEIIPVEGNLVYRETDSDRGDSALAAIRNPPWYAPVISMIGESSDIRGVLLLSSVVLILLSFGFLQPPAETVRETAETIDPKEEQQKPSIVTKWLARYDRSGEEEARRKLLERIARLESEADWELDALPVEPLHQDEL